MSQSQGKLRRAPLFAALDYTHLGRVRPRVAPLVLTGGELLFRQDGPAAWFYFVRVRSYPAGPAPRRLRDLDALRHAGEGR